MKNRKLPIGIQDFEQIRRENYVYVDKTEYIHRLVHTGKSYFLSRPRRFGKSLFLSTLKAYWEGKTELFDGLKIGELEKDNASAWDNYPVLYLDFNTANFRQENALESVLEKYLNEWEQEYGKTPADAPVGMRFRYILRNAFEKTGKRCVVLVDEYDKSLLETVEDEELLEHNRSVFKGFFSALKSEDANIQFVFITGVTKFSKVSIFSDLNQLEDISFDDNYSGICGITRGELDNDLEDEIATMAGSVDLSSDDCKEKLKKMYDGYHFSANGEDVYNPFSLLTALKKHRFGSYWFETGTPTFLVKRLKAIDFDVKKFSDRTLQATETTISDYRIDNPNPIPLLYQTGYLTIKDVEYDDLYTLGFPNEEVRYAFLESLMPEYIEEYTSGSGKDIFTLRRYAEVGDTDGIRDVLQALFASVTYTTRETPFEHYFQTVIYLVFTLLGKYTQCEMHTYTGRIDCVVMTKEFIYLFEFKRDKSAEDALGQIEDNDYPKSWVADNRKLYKIGVNFSSETRQMDDWLVR